MKHAFSLVELSIVLVILGLLTGGILAGQSLIRAAELRAVPTEYNRYYTAGQAFRDKYFSIPGDFRDATRFWGRMNSNADCVTNSSATVNAAGACDGSGNGYIDPGPGASKSSEEFQFWRHLAAAGLIEGTYTGLADSGSSVDATPGTNVPASKLTTAGWGVRNLNIAGDAQNFAGSYGNDLEFGKEYSTGAMIGGGLKPEEAWNIDTKVDDGKPATGKAIVYNRNVCTNSTSATDYGSDYLLSGTVTSCGFYFKQVF